MPLRNLDQDAIEIFFCAIRQCCRSGSDLTTVQFTSAMKTCLVTQASGGSMYKNCSDDSSYILNDMRSLLSKNCETPDPSPCQETVFRGCSRLPNQTDQQLNEIQKAAPSFMCAVIVNDVLSRNGCSNCANVLTARTPTVNFLLSKNHYEMRGLVNQHPSTMALRSFQKCIASFQTTWNKLLH